MVTAVALLLLLNDKCKPESLQRDGRTGWRFPQTAGCKARTCFVGSKMCIELVREALPICLICVCCVSDFNKGNLENSEFPYQKPTQLSCILITFGEFFTKFTNFDL